MRVLPNSLRKIAFVDGQLDQDLVVRLLNVDPSLSIVFRDVKIRVSDVRFGSIGPLWVHIQADELHRPESCYIVKDKPYRVVTYHEFMWDKEKEDLGGRTSIDDFLWAYLADVLDLLPVDPKHLAHIRKRISYDSGTARYALKRFDKLYYSPGQDDYSSLDLSVLRPATLHYLAHALGGEWDDPDAPDSDSDSSDSDSE